MRIDVHLHVHSSSDETLLRSLDDIKKMLGLVIQKENHMSQELDDLTASVAAEGTVIDSAIVLLNGLSAALAAAGTDPVKLAALKSDIDGKTASLADAIAANTPAAPTP
jgi:hypothetical protein